MSRPSPFERYLSIPGAPDPVRAGHDGVMVKVQSLGTARLVIGAQIIGPNTGMLLSLLLRVIFAPGHSVSRDTLLAQLWPDQPALRQRGNLRQALYKLRTYGVRVALVSGAVRFDRRQLERTFSVERTPELFDRDVTRGGEPFGAFLPGYACPSPAWQRWMEEVRDVVHGDVRRVLVEQLRMRRERVDWGGAAVLSRWLLQFDPLNEDATLTMAECTMLSGAKAEAVAILDRYLAELGPDAGDIRLPATLLRRRFTEPPVRRRPSLASTERHFVGREPEMADLSLAMRRARWHDGSAVLLHGPPGIGKTRLCTELGKVATIEGYREVGIDCRETDLHRPLAGILDALPALLSSPGALGSAPESLALLRRLVGAEVPSDPPPAAIEYEPTVSEVAGAVISAAERYERTMRTVRTQSIRHAIIDLVAAVSDERPIFLVIDDAHWLDDASWEVLADLIQRIGALRLFMLVTSRFGTVRAERPARLPAGLVVRRVPALSDEECVRLARAIGEDLAAYPTAEIEAWLIRGSEGTPLMLRALVDHWVITGEAQGIPPTLSVLLEQRLDRLSPTALMALQSISLLGRYASPERVGATLELPTHELLHAFEQLGESGCLAVSDAALVACHELLGKTARIRMTKPVEATLRASIARALESDFIQSNDLGILLEALTQNDLSSRPDVLYRFLCRHEKAILESGRPSAIIGVVERLQSTLPSLRNDLVLKRLHARLSLEAGEYRRSIENSTGFLSLPSDPTRLSESELDQLLSLADSAYRADPVIARDELARFAAKIATAPIVRSSLRLRAAEIGLTIAANTCDEQIAAQCYAALQSANDTTELCDKATRASLLFHAIFGDITRADAIATEIIELGDSLGKSTTTVTNLGRAAFALRLCGNYVLSRAGFVKQYELALELDAPRLAQYSAWQLAQLELDLGNIPQVEHWNQQLRNLLESDDDPISSCFARAHLCRCAIEDKDQERAVMVLDEVKAALPRFPTPKAAAYIIALELGAKLLDPAWDPSAALIDTATARHGQTSKYGTTDYLTSTICEALMRTGRFDVARDLAASYISSVRRERSAPSTALARTMKTLREFD
ncbi:MAG: ATP-binding protein [Gemmatimonas sp.]|uniref:ATP-binding protein n=1 Tax=Gemmatimonas sp. TaxID=1962908 RepID=UPI00391F3739|nr:AAA family ATPase [Gemmatimonadota bacterium]